MPILKKLKKISNTQNIGRVRFCLEYIDKQNLKNKTLVDVGSSFGWLEEQLKNSKLKSIIGIEPNQNSLEVAKKNNPDITFYKGSASSIPLSKNSCDIAVLFDVIEHVPINSEKKVFNEIARILKNDGILFLSTPYNHWLNNILDPAWYFGHRHYSFVKLIKLLNKSGFEVLKIEVRGNIWACLYMIWFYINKWIFMSYFKKINWLDRLYDKSYNKQGIHTVFLTARKS